MARLSSDPVIVLPEQREALELLVRTHSTPQQLAMRARIILQADEGVDVRESARELDVWPKTVRYWRKRWRRAPDRQSAPERLADAPRSGAPATFTPEQVCAVIAMTCEKPSESDRCKHHWFGGEMPAVQIVALAEKWSLYGWKLLKRRQNVVVAVAVAYSCQFRVVFCCELPNEPSKRR